MRIAIPHEAERFGANLFFASQKVYELDAGPSSEISPLESQFVVRHIPRELSYDIEKDMAIIIPCKNERLGLLEGVIVGIPHYCLPIVISNSPREPIDRFAMEQKTFERLSTFTKRSILSFHQRDPIFAQAFAEAGYKGLLDDNGEMKSGKAEGMILGTVLAKLLGKKYIGFIDSDNYFPGAVYEYIREYAAGFATSSSPYSMIRILWHSKPKVRESELYFAKYGRVSVVTNHLLNRLFSYYTGFDTDIIRTGNAGEHALTTELAMVLDYAAGYAIEPYHFINLLEKFGGIKGSPYPDVMKHSVEVYQIESRNPHLHESRGEEHVRDMLEASLSTIYHSFVTPDVLKEEILRELGRKRKEPAPRVYYPALSSMDWKAFMKTLEKHGYEHFSDGFESFSLVNP
jgi:mannosyl-3-phosphoglycerate synthase